MIMYGVNVKPNCRKIIVLKNLYDSSKLIGPYDKNFSVIRIIRLNLVHFSPVVILRTSSSSNTNSESIAEHLPGNKDLTCATMI